MGRRNGTGRAPQRSRLIANREERSSRAANAFSVLRPVTPEVTAEIHTRLRLLQDEDDIPASVRIFDHDIHSSVIQERRVRRGLAKGLAAGFVLGNALGHIKNGLPGHGDGTLKARFTGVDVIGRNRNVLVGYIDDEDGILRKARHATKAILTDMGLRLHVDAHDHVTLGVDQASGLTQTERRHVIHTAGDIISDIPILLGPVEVEHNGKRVPISQFKAIDV